jgi:hypothetical protein
MGFFGKLFGGGSRAPEPEPEPEPELVAVVVLRRGMSVPNADYVGQVLAAAFPDGLAAGVERVGLSQPSWFKTEEIGDSMAGDVAATFALKLGIESPSHRRHVVAGPEGAQVMIVELRRG